jgi:hypothetical protein
MAKTHISTYLTVEPVKDYGTRVTKVVKTSYGYRVQMFNNYITLYYLKVIMNENGSAKIHWRVEKNYHTTKRFTTYYGLDGFTVERKEYQNLNKI